MKTVLLVDDEPEVLQTLHDILSRAGYAVVTAADAESALAVIGEGKKVHCVITDNHMPGMKGSEFILVLKQRAPSIPVIMLTAHGSVETYIRSMTGGLFEYIHKPIQARELRRIVKAALDWSESRPAPAMR